ncbi:MAG: hypothetical protein CSB34_04880 [Desulfobulbus propionicus]|nr:MAG: hypothetical protein CSB34_04880 [Desulfobulbus propionicus]PIE66481.1 MAG: hypothetical protein CSA26_00765 [Desulfobacterales bacterium]
MTENRDHQQVVGEKKLLRRVGLVVIFLSLLALLFMPGRGVLHYRKMKRQVAELQQANQLLEQDNKRLAKENHRLKTDNTYIEEYARKKHNMLKPNEEVYDFNKKLKKK